MSEQLPAPLVPADVDLRDFQYMELDVRVLRDSRFAAQVSGDAFRAGVLLWCASWHQVPAGSLPDDDIELANLAGYGRFFKEWRKVRSEALTQFTKCSDGRLYHATVCEKAMAAWGSKLQHHYDRARDRLRKTNKARAAEGLPQVPELTFEAWNQRRMAGGLPMEKADASGGIPPKLPPEGAGIPAENALRGNGEGEGEGTEKETSYSVPVGTGGKPPETALGQSALVPLPPTPPAPPPPPKDPGPEPSAVDTIFAVGLPMLLQANVADRNARSFLGHLRKLAKGRGGDPAVVDALNRCAKQQAVDPVSFLQACLTPSAGRSASAQPDLDELTAGVQRRLGIGTPPETIDG